MIIIGSLYHTRESKGWKTFARVADILNKMDNHRFMYIAYGATDCDAGFLHGYQKAPSEKEKNQIYDLCDIWFTDTKLEGFHNVPAEAALHGCLIVCNRLDSNGMGDYATENTAMRFSTINEAIRCCMNPDYAKRKLMHKKLKSIGDRFVNMNKFVKLLK